MTLLADFGLNPKTVTQPNDKFAAMLKLLLPLFVLFATNQNPKAHT